MKKIACLAIFFLLTLVISAKSQTISCKNFREGTFKMNFNGKAILIKRYGKTQYEYLNNDQKPTMTFAVNWLSDCVYTLKPNAATLKKFPILPQTALLTVKIVKTTKTSYFISMSSNYSKEIISTEIIKTH